MNYRVYKTVCEKNQIDFSNGIDFIGNNTLKGRL